LSPLGKTWKSPVTGAVYPIEWKLAIPRLGLELEVKTPLESQELSGNTKVTPNYWEGAILLTGKRNGQPAGGVGYLEMTGYDYGVRLAE
jgi:predicted secreted hydrolase